MPRRISDSLISEICSENDIIDYVSQFVSLKKSGRDYSGLCPFHNEKTPSFHVSQDKQLFHCFGCGASGNLVQFVMRTENLDFVDALKLLADRAGIVIPEDDMDFSTESHEQKKRILEMNRLAARFFFNMLKDGEMGKTAREYFIKRHIPWKTITVYGLGYAPQTPARDALINYLLSKGYTKEQILEAGLAVEREGKIRDKFRDRVMFPIIDVRGNVIGFGGRIMNDIKEINGYTIPKYLNSAETPVFDKGRNLFSLNLAKNAKSTELILCEGYMDVISVYQAGIKNIVATLGTAITESQAKLMMRYANEILICYDTDEAGTKATLRAIDIINAAGGKSRVIRLKGAKDPDEYINKNGVEKFKESIRLAMPSTEFQISLIKSNYDITETDGKIQFINEVVDVFAKLRDPIEIDAYMNKVAEETEINKEAILSKYKEKTAKSSYKKLPTRQEFKKRTVSAQSGVGKKAAVSNSLLEAEKRLLGLMSQSRKLAKIVREEIPPDEFSTDVYRRLAKKICETYDEGKMPDEAMILNDFSDNGDEINEASAVFYNLEIYSGDEETVRDLIYKIKLEKLQLRINNETDAQKLSELFRARQELLKQKNTWEE